MKKETKYFAIFEESYGLMVAKVGQFENEDKAWKGLEDWRKETGNHVLYFLNENYMNGFFASYQNALNS